MFQRYLKPTPMKKLKLIIGILLVAGASVFTYAQLKHDEHATCTGSKNCNACKTCNYCGHCAKRGGSCGVCR